MKERELKEKEDTELDISRKSAGISRLQRIMNEKIKTITEANSTKDTVEIVWRCT